MTHKTSYYYYYFWPFPAFASGAPAFLDIILFFPSIWHILASSFSYTLPFITTIFSFSFPYWLLSLLFQVKWRMQSLLEDAFLHPRSKISLPAICLELFTPPVAHNTYNTVWGIFIFHLCGLKAPWGHITAVSLATSSVLNTQQAPWYLLLRWSD